MPKRSYEDRMEYYRKKMELLNEKYRFKRRHLENSVVDEHGYETEAGNVYNPLTDIEYHIEVPPETLTTIQQDSDHVPNEPVNQRDSEPVVEHPTTSLEPTEQISDDSQALPTLDPDIVSALGDATDTGSTWGSDIHNNLTQLWQPLLKNGLTKEVRESILKQYLIPANCTLLQAPKLNIEIGAAVAEMVRLRDKKVENSQQQLGIGITAISRALTSLLTTDNKLEAIKILSDGCRILCDLHHTKTLDRIKMISPGLAKPFLNIISDSVRDETLFGSALPEKIKAAKIIEKQGLQIKKITPSVRPNPTSTYTQARQQAQGNWSGPPRYPTGRGGRGSYRGLPPSTRRATSTTITPTTKPRMNQGRNRAPLRH